MTVNDLVQELQSYDPDLEVITTDQEGTCLVTGTAKSPTLNGDQVVLIRHKP